ncbi:MAG: energy-coupling factor transporter transmembrane component T [Coriobacteriia bacterium]|nr:energy-coupling factor transporter transmembrane component T [Coriobacteriia bacterium]
MEENTSSPNSLPTWIAQPPTYDPPTDRDGFITQSMLSVAGVLSQFRLDDGTAARFSPSAPVKLVVGLAIILLNSLSTNFVFTLVLLAGVLVRVALLPACMLRRVCGVTGAAAALAFVIMLPAILLGQTHSAVLIAGKTLVSVGTCMTIALSTPYHELTAGLRAFHVPSLFIFVLDLALKNIVRLGNVALEVLCALRLRSVGRNTEKTASMGGVSGVVLLKTKASAEETADAMACRGFSGDYRKPAAHTWRAVDAAWAAALVLIVVLFVICESVV